MIDAYIAIENDMVIDYKALSNSEELSMSKDLNSWMMKYANAELYMTSEDAAKLLVGQKIDKDRTFLLSL